MTNEAIFANILTIIIDYDIIVAKDLSFLIYLSVCLGVLLSEKPFRMTAQLRELPLVLDQQD